MREVICAVQYGRINLDKIAEDAVNYVVNFFEFVWLVENNSFMSFFFFFFNDTATTEIYTLPLHDALPISQPRAILLMMSRRRSKIPKDRLVILRQQRKSADFVLRPRPDVRRREVAHIVHVKAQQRSHLRFRQQRFRPRQAFAAQAVKINAVFPIHRHRPVSFQRHLKPLIPRNYAFPQSARAASNTVCSVGTVTSSSGGENGIRTCIAPMRFTGASRLKNAPSAMTAAISPVTPYRPYPSSTTIAREVFFADSISVLSSSGQVVRGSITSALTPIFSSNSAAPSATCTMLLVATIVMSSPSRFTSATPNGIVYSSSGTGPCNLYIILSSKN